MAFFASSRKIELFTIISVIVLLLLIILNLDYISSNAVKTVMGGQFYRQLHEIDEAKTISTTNDMEKYFRPSNLPALNNENIMPEFFNESYDKKPLDITLPDNLMKTPDDTVINYFSILKQAANPMAGKNAGCGTLGDSSLPYPIAYNFLTSTYQQKLNFDQYLKSFENILHISLIKLKNIPTDESHPNDIRYFVEIETIQGSDKDVAYFAYYYGYVTISKDGNKYKISDIQFYGEDYLCAPYHGWAYMAEYSIDIKYGDWCSLVKHRYPTMLEGYVKKIYFSGTDGNDYLFTFFQLTNGTDIEISQYKKNINGKWEQIHLDPEKCLKEKSDETSTKKQTKQRVC